MRYLNPHAAYAGLPSRAPSGQFLRLAQILAIIICVGIGISVCVGLRGIFAAEGGLIAWIVSFAVASVLGIVLGGLWHMLLEAADHMRTGDPRKFWTAVGLGAALTAVQAATSMAFLASAIGGADAVRHHQERMIGALSDAANDLAVQGERHQAVQAAVGDEVRRLEALRTREIAGRGPSGRAGDGPVSQLIANAIALLSGTGEQRDAISMDAGHLLQGVREQIAAARAASVRGDEAAFVRAFEAARAGLAEARGQSQAGLGAVSELAGSRLAEIRAATARVTSASRGVLGALNNPLPAYTALSRPRAVLIYSEVVPLAWSVAAAVDFLPLVMLVMLLLAAQLHEHDPEPSGDGTVPHLTVGNVDRSQGRADGRHE